MPVEMAPGKGTSPGAGPGASAESDPQSSFPATPEERELFGRILQAVLRVTLAGIVVGTACTLLLPGRMVREALLGAALPLLAAIWLARRGWPRTAALLVPLDMLALATVLLYKNDGLQDIAILIYPGVLAAAGLLLDRRSYLLATGLALLSLAAIAWGEANGMVRLVDPSHRSWIYGDLMVAAILLVSTAILVGLMVDGMRQSLATAVGRARELRESEARFRALFEMSPYEVLVTDLSGRIRLANQAFLAAHGLPLEQVVGRSAAELGIESDPAVEPAVRERLAGGGEVASLEARTRTRDGRERDALIAWRVVRIGEEPHVLSVLVDITARKHAELSAQRERTLSNALIDSLPGAFFLIDKAGRFLRWNKTYAADLGYTQEEMGRLLALDTVASQDRERAAERMQECFRDGGTKAEMLALARDGHTIPYYVTAVRVDLEGLSYFLGTAVDLSERKRLQEQLYRSQKMEAMGSLAGGIAHDFNNLLFAMSAFAELARRGAGDRPAVVAHLDKLLQSLLRARDLVAKILTFSRRGAPVTETVDLRALAEEVGKLLRASCPPGVRVRLSTASSPVLVRADPSEIHQVILNLGTNAAHAMGGSGGTLEISVGWSESAEGGPQRLARLSVRDEGCGIPEDVRHRIFDPYFTTKRPGEGTGLGLAVVHSIVSGAGGHVEVESGEGKGTRIDVLLPPAVADSPAATTGAQPTAVPPVGRGEKLALVDDDPLLATAIAEALGELGYDVELFVDSRAARRALVGAIDVYDLVISDEAMPHIGGLELAYAIRACNSRQKVLLLSAYAPSLDPAGEASGLPRLAKPVSLQRLADEVRRLLDGSQSS